MAAMLARASPRNPRVWIWKRSWSLEILLVACGSMARGSWLGGIPSPLSWTRMSCFPACSISMVIEVALASIEFSISSLTAQLGRSITSPAAIRLIRFWGSFWIFFIVEC